MIGLDQELHRLFGVITTSMLFVRPTDRIERAKSAYKTSSGEYDAKGRRKRNKRKRDGA